MVDGLKYNCIGTRKKTESGTTVTNNSIIIPGFPIENLTCAKTLRLQQHFMGLMLRVYEEDEERLVFYSGLRLAQTMRYLAAYSGLVPMKR